MVHLDNEILFSDSKKWAIKPWQDTEETWMNVMMWKKPVWKSCILYDVTFLKRQSYGKSFKKETNQRLPRVAVRQEGMDRHDSGGFFRAVKILCKIL